MIDKKPLCPLAGDEIKFKNFIKEKIKENIIKDRGFYSLIKEYFEEFFHNKSTDFDFSKNYSEFLKNYELKTLKGDRVKSFEECKIANFLYLNSIDYIYEKPYEFKLKSLL